MTHPRGRGRWEESLAALQQEMATRQGLWESEAEAVGREREEAATRRLMEEMEGMKRTHEAEYAALREQLWRQQAAQVTSAQHVEETEELVAALHAETEAHGAAVAGYQERLAALEREVAVEREAAARTAQELRRREDRFLDELTQRDTELAQAFNEHDNRVFVLERQLRDREAEAALLRDLHAARLAEDAELARKRDAELTDLRMRLQVLEGLLTAPQRAVYEQRIYNGGSVLDGSKWAEHLPSGAAALDRAPVADEYVIAHQEALMKSAKAAAAGDPGPTSAAGAWDGPGFNAGNGHRGGGAALDPGGLAAGGWPPEATGQPPSSRWDDINQTLIDMGYTEEDRAAVVMSGVDMEDDTAVFNYIAMYQETKKLERQYREEKRQRRVDRQTESPRPGSPAASRPTAAVPSPSAAAVASPSAGQNTVSPRASPSAAAAAAATVPTLRNPKVAKKECEALVASQLISPMSDDPEYCCTTLLSFVNAGVLTPKEILKPLKVPLKKESPHGHITVVNILDGLMRRGPLHVKAEVLAKKWIDRLLDVGRRSPIVGARVLQAFTDWRDMFSTSPGILHVLSPALERYFQISTPVGPI